MSSATAPTTAPVVLNYDEWQKARHELLLEEKKLTALKDQVNEKRRNLGGYILSPEQISSWKFMNTETQQSCTLYDLFGPKHNKLLIYHCMSFQSYPCGACAMVIKQFDAVYQALNHHTATVVVARAPTSAMKNVQTELGWKIPCYTCDSMDFSNHFGTERTKDSEDGPKGYFGSIPGLSSFYYDRTKNQILHHYSSFNRGVEDLEGYFGWLDRVPLNPGAKHPDRAHPMIPLPKDTTHTTTDQAKKKDECCNQQTKSANITQQVNLDTNGKSINFPNIHYVYLESKGDFSVICGQTWHKVHTQIQELKKNPNIKITGYLSLYKPKEQIYRAGVSIENALNNPSGDLKYEHVVGGTYLSFRLTGSYTQLPAACGMIANLIKQKDIPIRDTWYIENYLNDPHTTKEADLQTDIMIPVHQEINENKQ